MEHSNTANNKNFHYRTNSVKINDKIFQYIQKTLFLAHFPRFFGQKFFSLENPALSRTTSYGFLALRQNLEKTNDTIPRKGPERQKNWRKDRQTLLHRTLPANARVQKRNNKILVEIGYFCKYIYSIFYL